MTPGGPSAMDVRLFGSGFDRGAIAFAHIDDRPPVQLQTEWISPEELRVVLHREHWGELRMNFVGGLTPPPRR
jgi:hypothetical protein